MSFGMAKKQFDENLNLFANPNTEPEKYNLYAGLSNLAQGLENLAAEVEELKRKIHDK